MEKGEWEAESGEVWGPCCGGGGGGDGRGNLLWPRAGSPRWRTGPGLPFSQHLVTVCSMHSARLVCGRKMMQTVVMMITLDQILSLMSWVELCSPQKTR